MIPDPTLGWDHLHPLEGHLHWTAFPSALPGEGAEREPRSPSPANPWGSGGGWIILRDQYFPLLSRPKPFKGNLTTAHRLNLQHRLFAKHRFSAQGNNTFHVCTAVIKSHRDEGVLSQCLIISISVEPGKKFDFLERAPGDQAFLNLRVTYDTGDPPLTQDT